MQVVVMGSAQQIPLTARDAGLWVCKRCRLAQEPQSRCDRCGYRLAARSAPSVQTVWAWLFAGIIAYIPANMYPMLITKTLVQEDHSTIVGGVFELMHHGSYGIAIIILVASVGIPLGKFLAIASLAIGVTYGTKKDPHRSLRLFEVVEFIGRWSMIDVFVVMILAAIVQLDGLAAIKPGPAAFTFALSVVFTMLAAKSFDPRLIWDPQAKADDNE